MDIGADVPVLLVLLVLLTLCVELRELGSSATSAEPQPVERLVMT